MSFGARDLTISVLPAQCPGPTGCKAQSACPGQSGCPHPSLCQPPSDCRDNSAGHPTAWCTTTQENDRPKRAAGLEALRRQLLRALATG